MGQLRDTLVQFLNGVGSGNTPTRYSPDTIAKGGRCAQLVRESVEAALDLPPNGWEVAQKAHEFRKARAGVDRWASDYEKAAKSLGLEKPYDQMLLGDVGYWPYTARDGNAYGHTALFIGEWGGQKWYLENSDWNPTQRQQQGAKLPLGNVHVYVTPERALTRPRTVITPTRAMRMEDAAPPGLPPMLRPAPSAMPGTHYLYARTRVPYPKGQLVQDAPYRWASIATDAQGRVLLGDDGLARVVLFDDERAKEKGLVK